ncbi:MAG: carboxypeptidase-like regulatory domain-containing protein [Bacteroidetes bacterium]|nr:carboxypeptidase-like regulatory domain-containing protein [Bacteroidota bacterium]
MKTTTNFVRRILLVIIAVLSSIFVFSQQLTQTVKGRIVDADTEIPLPGATVVILDTDPLLGASADAEGFFRIEKVPLGRYDIKISYMGFEPAIISEIVVGSGKEVVVNTGLKETLVQLNEVVVTAETDKKQPLNSMAIISSRQVNMEEARRFAGAFDDPARLVTSYAGVAAGNMNSNGIIVRGNAPKGVLWRLEGLEIANPSHFANLTTFGGGGISSLSAQMIDNSDFYTAAFPAEFGNALSGVFDLRLRSGNRDKREHTFQAGVTGIDLSSEGPYKKGKPATYLFNYRYSTFGLIKPLLPDNAGLITYQDFSFKTDFPTKKAGIFSLWGIGSTDHSGSRVEKEPNEWEYEEDRLNEDGQTSMGALGMTHKMILGSKTLINSSLAFSGSMLSSEGSKMDVDKVLYDNENIQNSTWNYSLSSYMNHKFSARHTNRTGFTVNLLNYDMVIREAMVFKEPMQTITDDQGNSELLQAYSQSRFDLNEKLTLNAGFHLQYFTLTEHYSIEPRLGLRYNFKPGQAISFGYGLHSRLEMLFVYLGQQQTESGIIRPNTHLDFSRAHHFVVGYDRAIGENMNFRAEAYYQCLFSIPVEPGTSFSLINVDNEWTINQTLTNDGTGENFGLDLTLERFMANGYYFVLTGSIFNSTYIGGDKVERDSHYNKNFVFNILGGKEWNVGRNQKNNAIGINGKFSINGGDRQTPVDEDLTYQFQEVVYDQTRAFSEQKPTVFYLHLTLNYRKNKTNHASIWSFQILNALGAPEYFGYRYNYQKDSIDRDEQTIVIPNISYKIVF